MASITIQNHHDCYRYGKEIFLGKCSRKVAVKALVESGMSERSAVYDLQCVISMLSGKRYDIHTESLGEQA